MVPGIKVTGGSPAAPAGGLLQCLFLHLVGEIRVPDGNGPLRFQGTRAVGKLTDYPTEADSIEAHTTPMEVKPAFTFSSMNADESSHESCWNAPSNPIFSL